MIHVVRTLISVGFLSMHNGVYNYMEDEAKLLNGKYFQI